MMVSFALYLLLLLHIFPRINPTTAAAAAGPAYTAADFILLNCGASSNLDDSSGRSWYGDDARSRYAPPNAANLSSAHTASYGRPSVNQVPYATARVFHSPFTYTFPVLTGPKFLRLYFYPNAMYSDFDATQSVFSVTANGYTLLSNFSAFLNIPSLSNPYCTKEIIPSLSSPSFMKEFIINVQGKQSLSLTFSPNTNSFAFINGIEIVSIPDDLYFRGAPIKSTDQQLSYLMNDTALEKLYRLNVGGGDVQIQNDSGPTRGMFRAWSQDEDYICWADTGYTPNRADLQINYTKQTPPYSAPEIVYLTSRVMANTSRSLEWGFAVDSGFQYLLRLHFCEFFLEVSAQFDRVFTIQIDNQTAEIQADVISWAGGRLIPIFKDYITWVPNDGRRGKKTLRLSLFPNLEAPSTYKSALLNGLEIFKLSDPNRSLAAGNPEHVPLSSPLAPASKPPGKKKTGGSSVIYAIIGSVIAVLAAFAALIGFLILRRWRRAKDSATTIANKLWCVPVSIAPRSTTRTSRSGVSLPSDLCRHFPLGEIKAATSNFDDNFVIGRGGFGNVYKGFIDNGATTVAIKRLNPYSSQGAHEFLTEIEMLSKLRHLHLVSLIGYCNQNGEMILVYDYMSHGTLRDHLYNSDNSPLTWKQRLQICMGAAKGLHYLHTGAKRSIIHRDVKSTNILLDEKWVAKMSDFGLSKVGPTGGAHTHVSTVVKGSFGYVDPEYYQKKQLTDKSDVYSFGVVLFEVLCARPAIIPSLPREQVNLGEWAKFCCRKEMLEQIIDSNLEGQIAPECLSKFTETAVACLRDKGIERPSMSDVVWSLEFTMQLQEAADYRGDGLVEMSPSWPFLGKVEPNTTTDEEEMFSGTNEAVSRTKSSGFSSTTGSQKLRSGDIFSELINPEGR